MSPEALRQHTGALVHQLCQSLAACKQLDQCLILLQWANEIIFTDFNSGLDDSLDVELVDVARDWSQEVALHQITQLQLQEIFYSGPFNELSNILLSSKIVPILHATYKTYLLKTHPSPSIPEMDRPLI